MRDTYESPLSSRYADKEIVQDMEKTLDCTGRG